MEKTGLKHTSCANLTDSDLIDLACKRSETAMTTLFERYKDGVKVHIGKVVPSNDVEDVCMQSFLKAFLHMDTFNPSLASFKTWLYTIAWNTALDYSGKYRRDQDNMPTTSIDTPVGVGAVGGISDPGRSVDEQITTSENYESLISHIEGLSPIYRDIARDRFVGEHEYEEIADHYKLSLNTVKTRIRRAKEILLREMEDDEK